MPLADIPVRSLLTACYILQELLFINASEWSEALVSRQERKERGYRSERLGRIII